MWRNDPPAAVPERKLWLPHPGVERERVQKNEHAPAARRNGRLRLHVSEATERSMGPSY
jgi:hypothetical protein